MPLIAGLALNSSTDENGQRRTLWPLTVNSKAILPTAGTIETTVCVRVSSRRTMSPDCFASYGAAAAANAVASQITMVAVAHHIGCGAGLARRGGVDPIRRGSTE